jgi:hypothetical protein
MRALATIELSPQSKLSYHGVTEAQICETIDEAIQSTIKINFQEISKLSAREFQSLRLPEDKLLPKTSTGLLGESGKSVSEEETDRRSKLLAEYKAATCNPSNRQIYEARNSGIHKPQFYQWLKGKLPSDSATAMNFERFLREKKAPISRRPKE